MVEVNTNQKLVIIIMVIGCLENKMDKEYINHLLEINTKGYGKMDEAWQRQI